MIILLMGVSGAGKSTIGLLLAAQLGWDFVDADNLHPPTNIAKMKAGVPLTDRDRQPWLQSLQDLIRATLVAGKDLIVACSALKASYRDMLCQQSDRVKLVYLKGSWQVLQERLQQRQGHFMSPMLLPDQLATLEEPEGAITIAIADKTPQELVEQILVQLGVREF